MVQLSLLLNVLGLLHCFYHVVRDILHNINHRSPCWRTKKKRKRRSCLGQSSSSGFSLHDACSALTVSYVSYRWWGDFNSSRNAHLWLRGDDGAVCYSDTDNDRGPTTPPCPACSADRIEGTLSRPG